jgi:hypothetical protein
MQVELIPVPLILVATVKPVINLIELLSVIDWNVAKLYEPEYNIALTLEDKTTTNGVVDPATNVS